MSVMATCRFSPGTLRDRLLWFWRCCVIASVRDKRVKTGVTVERLEIGVFIHSQSDANRQSVVHSRAQQGERFIWMPEVASNATKVVYRNGGIWVFRPQNAALNLQRLFEHPLRLIVLTHFCQRICQVKHRQKRLRMFRPKDATPGFQGLPKQALCFRVLAFTV